MKFFPLTTINESDFMELSKEARLTFYEMYMNTNDYGVIELSRKYEYLDFQEKNINELVSAGYLLKLYEDKNIYAITYWNIENSKLKYRHGNSYSDILGKKDNGEYFLKTTPNCYNQQKILSDNHEPFNYINVKTDFD